MNCDYFGLCGGCAVYIDYEQQFNNKTDEISDLFGELFDKKVFCVKSKNKGFRNRGEFRIWHQDGDIFYAMSALNNKKDVVLIDSCQIINDEISKLMPILINEIKQNSVLRERLFEIDFLSTQSKDTVITLIYHKKLDAIWKKFAIELMEKLQISIIGRSRGEKIVLEKDFVVEKLQIHNKVLTYIHTENSFTQPNSYINEKMITWVLDNIQSTSKDLLELYCGMGNFTIALASKFNKVLATEISKSSIKSAKENCKLNSVDNITFVRMSSEDISKAIKNVREFNRLKEIDLKSYNFDTIFVDPPRSGLDEITIDLISEFNKVIYISCNPKTLYRDLEVLLKKFKVKEFAMFDQFPYTKHLECGVIIERVED